jgi:hypothetical protein
MSRLDINRLLASKSLAPEHLRDLQKSGIRSEAASAAGISTVPTDMLTEVLEVCDWGWAAPRVESILGFPYRSLNGGDEPTYCRWKVYPPIETEKGTVKYLQPKGSMNHVYYPPGVDRQGTDTIYVAEGEKKAYCLTLHGFPCIGLGGVYGWRKGGKAIPDFDLIYWRKRDVVIVFDADIAINDLVKQAEANLAQELIRRKARVFIIRLPYTPGCAKGADDFIVRHGKTAFNKLPPKPFKSAERNLTKQAPQPEAQKISRCGHYYFIEGGRLCLETYGKKGEPQIATLSNFTARIKEEITRDDGIKTSKEFHITGALDTDQPLAPAMIPAKEFDSLAWVKREWGAAASVAPSRSLSLHLVNAIQAHSKGFSSRTVYAHTGWKKINGVWRYLHGGGGIGSGDPIEVDLGQNLHRYCLPEPGGIEAAQASLRFLDIAPWEITAPLISCAYLAPFADLCKIDFSLWLYGPTGGLKSTVAALALSHFGTFSRTTLPGSWLSTANSLEKLCFSLKDTLAVIDDFIPASTSKESYTQMEKAARLIYQAGNRSSRGRLAADLSARPNYYPRCLIISTGEMLLPGQRQSATARYLGIELNPKKTPIDKARLTEAQGEAHHYPEAMAAYLSDLAPRLEDTQEEIQGLWEGYRSAFQSTAHLRIPEIQAWLAVGFEMFLRFQTSMGAISEDQSYEMLKQAWKIFEALGAKHSQIIEGQRPTLKFLAILKELFYQGRIYAESASMAGAPPQAGESLGWEGTEPARNAEFVGWADESTLYLMPETALRVVNEAIRRQGDFLALGRNDMLAALALEGFIEPGKDSQKGRNTHVKKIQGASKRVICLPLEKLAHDEVMEDENL